MAATHSRVLAAIPSLCKYSDTLPVSPGFCYTLYYFHTLCIFWSLTLFHLPRTPDSLTSPTQPDFLSKLEGKPGRISHVIGMPWYRTAMSYAMEFMSQYLTSHDMHIVILLIISIETFGQRSCHNHNSFLKLNAMQAS